MKIFTTFVIAWLGLVAHLSAQNVAIGPNLEIRENLESAALLAFATESTKTYQFEISADLTNWDKEGYAFRGTGGRMMVKLSNRGLTSAYFRLKDDAPAGDAAPYGPYGPYGLSSWNGESGGGGTGYVPEPRELVSPPMLPRTQGRILANRLSGGAKAFRLSCLLLGDSYVVDLRHILDSQVAPVRELGFGPTAIVEAGAIRELGRFDLMPTGTVWRLNDTGQSVQFSHEIEAYRVKVFYSTVADGGSFTLETSTSGGSWTPVPGAESVSTASGGGVGAGVFSYDFSTTERRRVRAKWASGTVRILGFVLSDIRDNASVNRGGCAVHDLAQGNIEVFRGSETPQVVWNTILQNIQPDFCTYKALDEWRPVQVNEYYEKAQQAWPMDWVMVSRHPMNASSYPPNASGVALVTEDIALRDFAVTKGQLFINARTMFPDMASMISLGLAVDGDVHLTALGNHYQNQVIMEVLSAALKPAAESFGLTTRPDFEYGARYRRNALGIVGAAGPQMMLDLWTSVNSGANYRPMFGISKLDDVETIGLHSGPANRCFAIIGNGGRMIWNNSNSGWGNGLPSATRVASAGAEFYAGDRTGMAPLAVSATSSHTGDVFAVYKDASAGSSGTRAAGISKDGSAEFARLKADLPVFPDHAGADSDGNLKSGQFYKLTGDRAVYQKP
ncbi:hypothetical protein OKA04_04890 [Luteolibacter flavescens]|uniref:Uncharacterized protein n=1 Tax=Luteolibacter flavescens TaxID=1859460 RepID=A0ABT3FL42_9BACT|nr:hypothetical protein [Luteolibacter flavescens]MCW1884054.1 hypothetical protein [Luteolibacter flavescens]